MAKVDNIAKNWRIWSLIGAIMLAAVLMMFHGITLGIDFEGGTMFQLQLSERAEDMEQMSNIIERRLNWTGFQDVRVYAAEGEFLFVVIRQTDPDEVRQIEDLLRQQGRFEVLLDGDVIFTGADFIDIDRGTGLPGVMKENDFYTWRLPFTLSMDAARRFRELTFHKCEPIIGPDGQTDYECEKTYFFMDRPVNQILLVSEETMENDRALFSRGTAEIPPGTNIDDVIQNIGAELVVVESPSETLNELQGMEIKQVIADPALEESFIQDVKELGFEVRLSREPEEEPWIWTVSGLKSIVRLTPEVTGMRPYVERPEDAAIMDELNVTGSTETREEAVFSREELKILLSSGALPVSVESMSRHTVSPVQGEDFLLRVALIGIVVLLGVAGFIFFRYRVPILAVTIVFMVMVEIFITLSFTSFLGQSLDMATLAGIIAAVGTGVDDQIIITDELLLGRSISKEKLSLIRRVKRAFFIIMAAAATTLATMLPIIMYQAVLVKITGFAIAISIGVLIGVLITRPAYGEIAKHLLSKY